MKDKKNIIIYVLIGIIIGLISAITVFLLVNRGDNNNNNSSNNSNNSNEEIVIVTEEQLYNEFNEIKDTKDENKLKTGFTNLVDFLFYGKEIKGKTLSDITDSTKLSLMKVALSIDSKIDDYFPDYKEKIGDKYQNIKAKVSSLYINTTTKICDNNPNLCENAKKDFNTLKETFGITYDYLKEKGIDGIEKLKEWYENFKA